MSLLLDPMEDLAERLEGLEDWLFYAQADTDAAAAAIHNAALAAGILGVALRAAQPQTPRLYAPDTTALGLLTALPSGLLADAQRSVSAAVAGLADDQRRPRQTRGLLGLLTNCADQDGTNDARLLADALALGGPVGPDQWLALEGGTRRWARRLDPTAYAAYLRFARAVLSDPLERFAATGRQ